jgi:hypothetical protein
MSVKIFGILKKENLNNSKEILLDTDNVYFQENYDFYFIYFVFNSFFFI